MEKMCFSVEDKENVGLKIPHPNKKQRKSLEVEQMPQKYSFIKDADAEIEHAEPKVERVVDECPPPHHTSHSETIYHIGE